MPRSAKSGGGGGGGGLAVDRLSSLPENIVVSILSLLPLRSAVATTVLSRQWRHRWTQITTLALSNFVVQNPNPNPNLFEFFPLLDHLFLELTSPEIHEFNFSLSILGGLVGYEYGFRFESHMQTWLRFLLRRNVKVIEISDIFLCFWFRLSIPLAIFTSRTLVELKLTARCDYDQLPDEISLPNLRKLDIMLDESHDELLSMLCRGCPLLEELRLEISFWDEAPLIQICGLSLKLFILELASELPFAINVLIDAPNLECIEMSSNLARYSFVTNPMGLIRAVIDFKRFDNVENIWSFMSPSLELLLGVSNARTLCLKSFVIPCALSCMKNLNLPTFRNLTCLSLVMCYRNSWRVLWDLL